MEDLVRQLSQVDAFCKLPREERRGLAAIAVHRQLPAGAFLCHQGDSWPHIALVVSGRLRWSLLSTAGQECVLYTTEAGRLAWGHTVFDGQPMPACVMAQAASDIYLWAGDQLVPVLIRYPAAMWDVQRMQVQTERQARERIYSLAFQPVAGRLAGVLLDSFNGQENRPVGRDLTLSELASMVASSPEVVCRALHHLQSKGIIKVSRDHMTLYNRSALQQLVEMA